MGNEMRGNTMNVTEWMAHLKDVLMADQHRLNRLRILWTKHYHHYHQTLSRVNEMSYAEMCVEHDELHVEAALDAWMRRGPSQPTHKPRPALPGDILRELNDELYPQQEAAEMAVKAWGLLASPGSGNVDEVKRRIGPVGEACYEAMGGVRQLCRQTNEEERGTFIAQFRDLAEAKIIRRNRRRELSSLVALPAKAQVQELQEAQPVAAAPQLLAPTRVPDPKSTAIFQQMVAQLAAKKAMAQEPVSG